MDSGRNSESPCLAMLARHPREKVICAVCERAFGPGESYSTAADMRGVHRGRNRDQTDRALQRPTCAPGKGEIGCFRMLNQRGSIIGREVA
jgi:hypothetical protein